jgi:hypothetical protein
MGNSNKILQFVAELSTENYIHLAERFVKLTIRFIVGKTNEVNICKSAVTHVVT